ncbi:KPN_02809 family neutral zinc metallopeptidase [Macrococcus bovicus]|uniref:KPN_02809 family neutral zinc metallopeptidase n=1 Tax=Macrococcus bovicus TaxID=69968 RepID=UPI0025A5F819|nr:neutral zinc metallopeptidase [Macrococcus bovicus]WJP98157.1 neutral zinc metallopeptidase [Macrococcus bovicus]
MQWQGRQGSSNVEDISGGGGGFPGGGMAAGGGGVGCLGIIVAIIYMLITGNSPGDILGGDSGQQQQTQQQQTTQTDGSADDRKQFASVVLKDTEDVWNNIFQQYNRTYHEPKMVLFSNGVNTACGSASSSMGPFYCPGDQKLYIDLTFMDQLEQQLNAPGDFAMAYVIAHEVGHHVQYELGISDKVNRLRQQLNETEFNKYSVALELQADYFAGVYAHYENEAGITDEGDMEEAIKAAHAVGDDTLQRNATGRVNPESFTHGTSEQRMKWFKKGFDTGDVNGGDTFSAMGLDL